MAVIKATDFHMQNVTPQISGLQTNKITTINELTKTTKGM